MEIIDKSGQSRSDQDLQEAIDVCKEVAIKHTCEIPTLTIHIMDIISLLQELQAIRRLLAEAREKKNGTNLA
jgi:hypothetical protein